MWQWNSVRDDELVCQQYDYDASVIRDGCESCDHRVADRCASCPVLYLRTLWRYTNAVIIIKRLTFIITVEEDLYVL